VNLQGSSLLTDNLQPHPTKLVVIAALLAVAIATFLLLPMGTPRARLNVMQVISVLFYLLVILGQAKTVSREGWEHGGLDTGRRGLWLALTLGAAAWLSVIWLGFISDDFVFISAARRTGPAQLWEFLGRQQAGIFFRPVGFAMILLDYHLWGHWAAGYHATNLLIHLLTVAGLFFLCLELGFGSEVAAISSLIFAILPIHAETVAWMVSRFDLLSACFSVWAIVFYLGFRNRGGTGAYIAALVFFLLAALSKENAYVLPLLLLLAEYLLIPSHRFRPLLGFVSLAAVLFCYRWILLGGIGGYSDSRGQPATLQIGFKTLEGVFIRGPGQLLLGYNWLQPPVLPISVVASLTAAVLLLLALVARVGAVGRKRTVFCLCWIGLTIVPAHPLLLIGAGLPNSRVLHMGSIGLALLIALLLAGLSAGSRIRRATAGVLVLLLTLGVLHNLEAWRRTSQLSNEFFSELKQLEPSPPAHAEFVFRDMPDTIRGVFFLREGLSEAIRMAYGRDDLDARRVPHGPLSPTDTHQNSVIELQWAGETPPLLQRIRN
jgi:hypothetical protein